MRKLMTACVLSLAAIVGCAGGSRLDATNSETLKKSLDDMTKSMEPSDKAAFNRDLGTLKSANRPAGGMSSAVPSDVDLLKKYNGFSSEQIHDAAVGVRNASKSKK